MTREKVDFAIVTALSIERQSIIARLSEVETIQEPDQPLTFYKGFVKIPGSLDNYSVVVIQLLNPGNMEAATATTRLLVRWSPCNVIMVGIGGGVSGTVELGDVVVADYVHYYEMAKSSPLGDEGRPQQFLSNRLLYDRAKACEATDWKSDIGVERPDAKSGHALPVARFGPIGSGEKVIANCEIMQKLLHYCPKMLAVGMEGAGVGRAVISEQPSPGFMEIRGISDFADPQKNDEWHDYAANAAASFAIGLLRSRPVEPVSLQELSAESDESPLFVLCLQSLRLISADELPPSLPPTLKHREIEVLSLDFTDLVQEVDGLPCPQKAAQRLTDPAEELTAALARRRDAQLVFHGLAHIPLAVLTGKMVTDRQPVLLFDYHPSATPPSWRWPNGYEYPQMEIYGAPKQEISTLGIVFLRVSVSYRVETRHTGRIGLQPLLEIDLRVPQPVQGIVRSQKQVSEYGREFRRILDLISDKITNCEAIHLFYAGPVALAFHLGQQISGNIHPNVVVWNFRGQQFEWGIDINEAVRCKPCIIWPK